MNNNNCNKIVLAAGAHPDDIEFMMGGTLLKLKNAGYQLNYLNVANGSCGSMTMNAEKTVTVRTKESQNAADFLHAQYHPPLVDDLMVYYTPQLVARLCALVRKVKPQILLIPSPQDYMEDHTNVSRLMVTAAFCRNMPNFPTDPQVDHIENEMAVYHALPYGLKDQLRNPITPDFYIDISNEIQNKRTALACHQSQKQWLDDSQGMDSYLITMEEMSAQVGKMSGKFKYAEGWRRHSHLGFADENFDPLADVLKNDYSV